jgi:hypothetical protein
MLSICLSVSLKATQGDREERKSAMQTLERLSIFQQLCVSAGHDCCDRGP